MPLVCMFSKIQFRRCAGNVVLEISIEAEANAALESHLATMDHHHHGVEMYVKFDENCLVRMTSGNPLTGIFTVDLPEKIDLTNKKFQFVIGLGSSKSQSEAGGVTFYSGPPTNMKALDAIGQETNNLQIYSIEGGYFKGKNDGITSILNHNQGPLASLIEEEP